MVERPDGVRGESKQAERSGLMEDLTYYTEKAWRSTRLWRTVHELGSRNGGWAFRASSFGERATRGSATNDPESLSLEDSVMASATRLHNITGLHDGVFSGAHKALQRLQRDWAARALFLTGNETGDATVSIPRSRHACDRARHRSDE